MPFSSKKLLNSFEWNPSPQIDLKHFIFSRLSDSARSLNRLKYLNASNFSFKKTTHINREKSSKIKRYYLLPPNVDG